jgi:DNA-binding beta-propeller fold protein YncE
LRTTLIALAVVSATATAREPLVLEQRIALNDVSGRIDHLALDEKHRRLFVAELGNNSVDVIDLDARKPLRRLSGIPQPQGVGYAAASDTLCAASAGDGALHLFSGRELSRVGTIALGSDADNVRVDASGSLVYVGYGDGAIAIIDTASRRRLADITLPTHPEGFQLDAEGKHIYINLPEKHAIAIADLASNTVSAQIPLRERGENFPIALDATRQRLYIALRNPGKLIAYALQAETKQAAVDSCNDADDIFVDAKRERTYVSCGDGYIDVFSLRDKPERIAHVRSAPGARTSLFVAELDEFFVAVRASAGQGAAIWIYRPRDD